MPMVGDAMPYSFNRSHSLLFVLPGRSEKYILFSNVSLQTAFNSSYSTLSFSQVLQGKYENAAGDDKKIKTTAQGRIPNLK